MNQKEEINWSEANKNYLSASIRMVTIELEYFVSQRDNNSTDFDYEKLIQEAQDELVRISEQLPGVSALDNLSMTFGLTNFEKNMLLLAAGTELDSRFAQLLTSVQGDAIKLPSFSLALAVLPDAHWNGLLPSSPLRYWKLIETIPAESFVKTNYRIDEQILNYLLGLGHLNEMLFGIFSPFIGKIELVDSQKLIASQIGQLISSTVSHNFSPVILLQGSEIEEKEQIAAKVSEDVGTLLYRLSAQIIPDNNKDVLELSRYWNREGYLSSASLLLDCTSIDIHDAGRLNRVSKFVEEINGVVFIACKEWIPDIRKQKYTFHILPPSTQEQYLLWQEELGEDAKILDGHLSRIVSQFNLGSQAIRNASFEIKNDQQEEKSQTKLSQSIWKACCKQSSPKLNELAQRIEPIADWDDIVLPDMQKQLLMEVASNVKQRVKVYEEWGFGEKSARGLGVSVLFTGESGTGKTMASEILAKALQLDLYKIDLSQVVNKYIGETEKNLKKVFDAAEAGGAVLLFDEADALFGKRSEVRDSHDRYANIEVSYLLQRMESYRGLAILTTNLKSAMDKAFLRRIRFIVNFPFPDINHRAEIWKKIFPAKTPLINVDIDKLARLSIAGGNIRNIALNAAFIAAEAGSGIRMEHIEKAARYEYAKLEKPMSVTEMSNWS